MNVWSHTYQETTNKGVCHGLLLKFQFNSELTGYGALQPWPDLGDLTLEEEIKSLLRGEPTTVFYRTLNYARLDAQARNQNINLFSDLKIPESHQLIQDLSLLTKDNLSYFKSEGYRYLKIKCGVDLKKEKEKILDLWSTFTLLGFKLRLDFNGKVLSEDVIRFTEGLNSIIDFIEDPCPFSLENWRRLKDVYGLRLALDRELRKVPSKERQNMSRFADVLVLKPTIQNPEEIISLALHNNLRAVVTSNLDHDLGILASIYEAGILNRKYSEILLPCGLQTRAAKRFEDLPKVAFGFEEEFRKIKWNFLL